MATAKNKKKVAEPRASFALSDAAKEAMKGVESAGMDKNTFVSVAITSRAADPKVANAISVLSGTAES